MNEEEIKVTVGERIKARRQELELTQKELADKLGCTFQLISRYENNVVDTIPTKKLKQIADVLRCSPYDLMEGFKEEQVLTPEQVRLIERIKQASPEDVARIEVMFDAMRIPRL